MIFILSLILAFFVWLIHNLSLDYFSYLQFRVSVTTSIPGYEANSVSEESLVIHGKAPGVFFLSNGRVDGLPSDMHLTLDPSLFYEDSQEGTFYIKTSEIRETLTEYFGEQMEIDFVGSELLHFQFEKANCKKVPVTIQTNIIYKPQYMLVDEIALSPDSVMVYGTESNLANISTVRTKVVSRRSVDKSLQGFVGLESIPEIRVDVDRVQYSMNIQRYVELSQSVNVDVVNLPSDKTMMLLPSTVKMTYRVPFKSLKNNSNSVALKLVVDYNDFTESLTSKVIPSLDSRQTDIFTYSLEPEFVECVLVEK